MEARRLELDKDIKMLEKIIEERIHNSPGIDDGEWNHMLRGRSL
jgi:hypothetical protein